MRPLKEGPACNSKACSDAGHGAFGFEIFNSIFWAFAAALNRDYRGHLDICSDAGRQTWTLTFKGEGYAAAVH